MMPISSSNACCSTSRLKQAAFTKGELRLEGDASLHIQYAHTLDMINSVVSERVRLLQLKKLDPAHSCTAHGTSCSVKIS